MISSIIVLWKWIGERITAASIYIGVALAVAWQVYAAGANKQKVKQYEKERKDADERNKISAEVDATDPGVNRRRLLDRWSAR